MKVGSHKIAELDVLSLNDYLNKKVGTCSLAVSHFILDAATNSLDAENKIKDLEDQIEKLSKKQ
jgi:hypothetical protein